MWTEPDTVNGVIKGRLSPHHGDLMQTCPHSSSISGTDVWLSGGVKSGHRNYSGVSN